LLTIAHRNLYFTAEGHAQSKKLARRKSAIIVLEEMKKVIEAEEKEKPQQDRITIILMCSILCSIINSIEREKGETKRRLHWSKKKKKLFQIYHFILFLDLHKFNKPPKENIIQNSMSTLYSMSHNCIMLKLEREPIYQVISERSVARKKEFVMQCTINDKIATGMGPNKKTAKKNAAENMLRTMGHAPSVSNYYGRVM